MASIGEFKQTWRVASLALLILALTGPWTYDVIHVPAEYACSPPNIRLEGDFCGTPLQGISIIFWLIQGLMGMFVPLVTGTRAFADSAVGFLVQFHYPPTRGENAMAIRKAEAAWNGSLKEGGGNMKAGSGLFDVPFSFSTRFEDEPGTNPEELIGAALAGCFSMFLSGQLTDAGFPPTRIHTGSDVHLGRDAVGPVIEKLILTTEADVPGVDQAKFDELVAVSKKNCPISRALSAVKELEVHASLV